MPRFARDTYAKVRETCGFWSGGCGPGDGPHCVGDQIVGACGPLQKGVCGKDSDCMSNRCTAFICQYGPGVIEFDDDMAEMYPDGSYDCKMGHDGMSFVGAEIQNNRMKCYYDKVDQDSSARPYMAFGLEASAGIRTAPGKWQGNQCFPDDPKASDCKWFQ